MVHAEDICERFWSLPSKATEEAKREALFLDDIILKAHLDREIDSRLAGVDSVLDAGAGTVGSRSLSRRGAFGLRTSTSRST
ncbi:MAG: hypothetical protein P8Y95_16955 [Gammaproteobacteria bacterium]|jgi:hypothetical protein